MRLVKWTDKDGYKHLSYIKDDDPDEEAPNGIPADPPILGRLDWAVIEKELHNLLVDRGLINWQEVQRQQNALISTILGVLKRKIVAIYRE